ncbi:MAG: hypothetical protein COC12_01855 [Rhodobacteraceae bacterium]|nr:MAG: hypothetical protein COC12_01855 [Paracoccaceae bacterium]
MGKFGKHIGSALAIGAAVAAMPDKAEAEAGGDEFARYCSQIANGEILETELTPQNMKYIFDEDGNVIRSRVDELTQYYGDGITEECGTGDVGAYVSQYGKRVMLEIYPPGQYPLGIDPRTMEQIQANYAQCVGEALKVVDTDGNGQINGDENSNLYRFEEKFCNEELQGEMLHAAKIAELDQQIAAAEERTAAAEERMAASEERTADAQRQIEAITNGLINGAREEAGIRSN